MACTAVAGAAQDLDHVGQVVFAAPDCWAGSRPRASRRDRRGSSRCPCWLRGWPVAPAVAGLLLHHLEHVARGVADHAAVAGRIVHDGRSSARRRRCLRVSCSTRRSQRLGAQQRAVAVKHHQVAVQRRQRLAAHHDGMAGTLLLRLLDESDARARSPIRRTSSAWWPTTTKMRSGGASSSAVSTTCSTSVFPPARCSTFAWRRLHARAESGGQDHDR